LTFVVVVVFFFAKKLSSERTRGLRAIPVQSYKQPKKPPQIDFTCSDFPCHLKVNRDKLLLINHQWECEKGKSW